jgi:soluble lytic murein transglycosylase-like protein
MIESLILCGALLCAQPVPLTISTAANEFGVSPDLMTCIAYRESTLNPLAVGDQGLAHGLFQFHLGTWRWMREMMGEALRDQRFDPLEAARTASWAISQGLGFHWSVWELCS